jgi:hypothetical protein
MPQDLPAVPDGPRRSPLARRESSQNAVVDILRLHEESSALQSLNERIAAAETPEEAQAWIEGPRKSLLKQYFDTAIDLQEEERKDRALQKEEERRDRELALEERRTIWDQRTQAVTTVALLAMGFTLLRLSYGNPDIYMFLSGLFLTGGVVMGYNSEWARLFMDRLPGLMGRGGSDDDPNI